MKVITTSFFLLLIYPSNGQLLGGTQEVSDQKELQEFANKALAQLEKASNNINARKIIEVILRLISRYIYLL